MRQVSAQIKALEKDQGEMEVHIQQLMMSLPNMPHHTVPEGTDDTDNPVVRQVGQLPTKEDEQQYLSKQHS